MRRVRNDLIICFSLITFMIPASGLAEPNKSNFVIPISEKKAVGFWGNEDCKKVSDAAGFYLHTSGALLQTADKERKSGNKKESKELYEAVHFFSGLSADAATNFQTFCKR